MTENLPPRQPIMRVIAEWRSRINGAMDEHLQKRDLEKQLVAAGFGRPLAKITVRDVFAASK
jgi:hypothetical protein